MNRERRTSRAREHGVQFLHGQSNPVLLSSPVPTTKTLCTLMAANSPEHAKPTAGQPAASGETYIPITFEDRLNQFWQKNRGVLLALSLLVLAAIVGKGIWEYMQRQNAREVQAAFQAANTPEKRRAFIAANPDSVLAGVAELQLADEAYSAGKGSEALAGYEKAIGMLEEGPLQTRAKMGRALSKVMAGKTAEATADLKQIANDTAELEPARTEAAYHLASLAAEAGDPAEAQKYIDQLNQIDPGSMWARRAMMLQASLPRPAAPAAQAPATETPAAQGGNTGVQITLPGK